MAVGEFGLGKEKTIQTLKAFIENVPDYQIVVVSGKNEKLKESFEQLVITTNAKERVRVLGFTDKVPELMAISSLVVSKPGGLTTTESLVCELPMIIINPIPGQEEENAEFLENHGVGIWIHPKDEPEKIILDLFHSDKKLEEMSQNAKIFSLKNSTQEICKIILG